MEHLLCVRLCPWPWVHRQSQCNADNSDSQEIVAMFDFQYYW